MGSDISGVGHVGAFHGREGEVLDEVDLGDVGAVDQLNSTLVAGEGVELFGPGSLGLGGAEPLGERLDGFGLFLGAAFLVQDADVLGDVVGAVVDVNELPAVGDGVLGAFRRGVQLAVERRGVERGNGNVALVQRIKAVLPVVAAELALGAVLPQGLPAIDGDAAGGRGGIGEGVEHGGVDVGVGRAADLVLAVPGVAAVNDVGPVRKVQLFAVGAELVGTVEHEDVLDDEAVGLAIILVFADFFRPGRSPVNEGQVLVDAVHDLAPAGLVQTEEDVAVLLLVGSLDGGRVAGDDAVVVNADGEAGFLRLVHEPRGALGGVGVGVDADGVAGVILRGFGLNGLLGGRFRRGFRRLGGRSLGLGAAGSQREDHDQSQNESKCFLHGLSSS